MNFYDTKDYVANSANYEHFKELSKSFYKSEIGKKVFFKPVSTSENQTKHKIAFFGINAYSDQKYLDELKDNNNFAVEVQESYTALKEVMKIYEAEFKLTGQSYYTNIVKNILLYVDGYGSENEIMSVFYKFPILKHSIENLIWSEVLGLIINGCDYFVTLGNLPWSIFELSRYNLTASCPKVNDIGNGNISFDFNGRKIYFISEYHFSRPNDRKKEYTKKIISEILSNR